MLFSSPPNEAFDLVTRIVSRTLDAPIALITVIAGDRQYFKSAVGLAEPWETQRQTPISHSLCRHVIDSGEPLVVSDARPHPLVRDNPAIEVFGLQAYVGVPLRRSNGQILGALCAIDVEPHEWSDGDVQTLRDLATSVVTELEWRQAREDAIRAEGAEKVRRSEQRFGALVTATAEIAWTAAPSGRLVSEQPTWAAFTGQREEEYLGYGWLDAVHPDDRQRTADAWTQAVAERQDFFIEYRVRRHDGEYRDVEVRAIAVQGQDGEIAEWVGMNVDISERRKHEDERRFLAEANRLLSTSIDYDATLQAVSRIAVSRLADWCGIDVLENGVLRRVATAHHDPSQEAIAQELLAFLRTREATRGIAHVVRTGEAGVYPAGHPALTGATARDPEEARLIAQLRVTSAIIVPLVDNGVPFGAITLARSGVGPDYTIDDLPLAQEVAMRASSAVAHALLLRQTEEARLQLQEQAVELEHQLEALQTQAILLEEHQTDLESLNADLKASERRVRAKLEASPIPTYLWRATEQGLVLAECNAAARVVSSDAIAGAIGKTARALYGETSQVCQDLETCFREQAVVRRPALMHRMLNGEERSMIATYAYVAPDTVMVHAEDITDMMHIASSLHESERWVRSLFDNAPDGIVVHSLSGHMLDVNAHLCTILGYTRDEILALNATELVVDGDGETLRARWREMQPGVPVAVGRLLRHKDGSAVPVEAALTLVTLEGQPVLLTMVRDVTERVRLEEQLRQASKMEAVGRLSGGVAHDFNNMLQSILGHTELLLTDMPADSAARQDLEEVRRSAVRAADLTRQLLAFSRQQVLQPRPLSLSQSVVDVERMLSRIIGEDIEFVTTLHPDAGMVAADPTQVEQVILNLAVNARDAMPDGGALRIEVRNVTLAASDMAQLGFDGEAGDYVLLEFGDNGHGMSAETLNHIFEPFFTTKEVGLGTGLGLATVFGIVSQSGGQIHVQSAPGQGTRFQIFLPRLQDERVVALPHSHAAAASRGGSETVLLVEDQEDVRRVAARVLRRAGYTVIEASNGTDGLAAMRAHEGAIHLILTDAIMPQMGGRELAERARAERPGVRVLCMSGYASDTIAEREVNDPAMAFIQKPFTPSELSRQVRSLLDRA